MTRAVIPKEVLTWRRRWVAVYAINLIVPLLFGWQATASSGRVGMLAAILVFWAWPRRVAQESRTFAFMMLTGGAVVATFQLIPVLHIFSGAVALGIASSLGQTIPNRGMALNSELGGFIATAITGSLLQGVAMVLGGITWLLFGGYLSLKQRPTHEFKKIEWSSRPPVQTGVFDRDLDG